MITHIIPKTVSTSSAKFVMSNCDIISANVEPPRDNGEPGTILWVGLGVGVGVGVGVAVGVGVDVGTISSRGVEACEPPADNTTLIISTISIAQASFLKFPPLIGGCLKI